MWLIRAAQLLLSTTLTGKHRLLSYVTLARWLSEWIPRLWNNPKNPFAKFGKFHHFLSIKEEKFIHSR